MSVCCKSHPESLFPLLLSGSNSFSFPRLSELGLLMKSCIDQGQLVPDDVISRLILRDLRALENSSWLLDGGSPPPSTRAFRLIIGALGQRRSVRKQVTCSSPAQ